MTKAVEDLMVAHQLVEDDSFAVEIHVFWDGTGRDCHAYAKPFIPAAAAA